MTKDEVRILEASPPNICPLSPVAHCCRCHEVSRCTIFVHPSSIVQAALNQLVDAMAAFDEATGACSVLILHSIHAAGVFTSVTRQGRGESNSPTLTSRRTMGAAIAPSATAERS